MIYFVYILQSQKDQSYYIGSTRNIEDRLTRHNEGRSKYTKSKRPWSLVYTEQFETRSEAVLREDQIKHRKSIAYIEQL